MLNKVAFNNFIEKTLQEKGLEYSEKTTTNLTEREEKILKEILYKERSLLKESKTSEAKYISIDDLEALFKV
ncbi:hypothetical protein SAMN05660865_00225 [Caloramator fervidus]|mgnify:CR=1 FL=1|uniref:Uncharacterized protein n=1 Tax=Caloramator fervidus TaxID=29344 RepID=A0A1H5RXM6_9CLOT|nr:hypothetical protein [Caloramator fervidus]SEF42251.1 hypothetical protein SAMN05660865_00225 [Caloramator fervidus]